MIKLNLWAYPFHITDRSVVSLSYYHILYHLRILHHLFYLCSAPTPNPQVSARCTRSANNPLLVKLPKSRITPLICSSFLMLVESTSTSSSISFLPLGFQDSCSPPSEIIPNLKPWSFLPSLTPPQGPSFLPEFSSAHNILFIPCVSSLSSFS